MNLLCKYSSGIIVPTFGDELARGFYLRDGGYYFAINDYMNLLCKFHRSDRTSIHKALADERILSYKTVQALARHFNLSVDERKDFFQLYDILLQGEETYNNRQAVCRLLNNLASVDFSMAPPPEVSSLSIS